MHDAALHTSPQPDLNKRLLLPFRFQCCATPLNTTTHAEHTLMAAAALQDWGVGFASFFFAFLADPAAPKRLVYDRITARLTFHNKGSWVVVSLPLPIVTAPRPPFPWPAPNYPTLSLRRHQHMLPILSVTPVKPT